MTILCTEQTRSIFRGISRQDVNKSDARTTSDSPSMQQQLSVKSFSWKERLLGLAYAVQFPVHIAFHPLVCRAEITRWSTIPSLPRLVGQVIVFLFMDYSSWHFCSQCYKGIFNDRDCNDNERYEDTTSALAIAIDFTASGITFAFAIAIIQLSSNLTYLTGEVHFAAILCWLLLRSRPEF